MPEFGMLGGLALLAGIVILLFPKVFFALIGTYMVLNALLAFLQGAELWFAAALGIGGILVFIAPGMVAWFIAFYLGLFCILLFIWGFWFLAIPGVIFAFLIVLAPKFLPLLVGGFLTLLGGLTLLAAFLRG